MGNVNPELINPKRLFNWESIIKKYWRYQMKLLLEEYPLINKPWFSLIRGCKKKKLFVDKNDTFP